MAATFSKPSHQLYLMLCGLFCLAIAAQASVQTAQNGAFPGHLIRLTVLELGDAARAPSVAGVQSFGLLRDGCRVPAANLSQDAAPASLTVEAPLGASPANGYYFIPAGAEAIRPARWLVESSGDGGRSWTGVGASYVRRTLQLDARGLVPGLRYSYPGLPGTFGEGAAVTADARPPAVLWFISYMLPNAVVGLGICSAVAAARMGREGWALPIVIAIIAFQVSVTTHN